MQPGRLGGSAGRPPSTPAPDRTGRRPRCRTLSAYPTGSDRTPGCPTGQRAEWSSQPQIPEAPTLDLTDGVIGCSSTCGLSVVMVMLTVPSVRDILPHGAHPTPVCPGQTHSAGSSVM